jgi:hypothetical protein
MNSTMVDASRLREESSTDVVGTLRDIILPTRAVNSDSAQSLEKGYLYNMRTRFERLELSFNSETLQSGVILYPSEFSAPMGYSSQ